jgi:all-trans-retinol dehydrogenase (NAD+)
MTSLAARNVVVTGAASGIGRALAERLAARAAHVILWDIDDPSLKSVVQRLREGGGRVSSYHCDVADRAAVYDTARRVVAKTGPIDILINNAGVVSGKYVHELSDAEIERSFAVNALAHFWTTRAFLPEMIERNSGHIVTIASAGGLVGTARLADYCASKFAAVGFNESLRQELRQQSLAIRTTVVCPFFTDTGMFAGVKSKFPWLLPILEPERVADRTIAAIERNRQRLLMPWFTYVALPLRVLPPRTFDALLGFFGVATSMQEFRGRGERDRLTQASKHRLVSPATERGESEGSTRDELADRRRTTR